MKKIRTADGGILFLDGEDYMPKLLAYLRETAGYDAANAVEEWAQEQTYALKERLVDEQGKVTDLRNRVANLEAILNDERDSHIDEITELEEELVRLAEVKDRLMAANEYMTDLINNPEKLFPPIGTKVYRDIGDGTHDVGPIEAYKLRVDARTGKPEFFVRIGWRYMGATVRKLKGLGKAFHILEDEGPSDGG